MGEDLVQYFCQGPSTMSTPPTLAQTRMSGGMHDCVQSASTSLWKQTLLLTRCCNASYSPQISFYLGWTTWFVSFVAVAAPEADSSHYPARGRTFGRRSQHTPSNGSANMYEPATEHSCVLYSRVRQAHSP